MLMAGRTCCVKNCRRRSHDHRRRKIPNGLSFHWFPSWKRNEGAQMSELTWRRRAAWVAAVGRSDITLNHISPSVKVCSRHFHSGKPAYEMLDSDPDWVPSLHMGHDEENGRRRVPDRDLTLKTGPAPESRTPPTEPEAGPAEPPVGPPVEPPVEPPVGPPVRPPVCPWGDVKSLLQSVLQCKNMNQQQPPAVTKTDLSFRDFFRDALEASLEASSRSRTLSGRQPSVCRDFKVELNIKLPPGKEEQTCEESSSSSSTCLNCVKLQDRITELQEKLTLLNQPPPDQDLQGPDVVHPAEAEKQHRPEAACLQVKPVEVKCPSVLTGTEPLPPSQVRLREGGVDGEVGPAAPVVSRGDLSLCGRYRPSRFREIWLKTFWFLRYSRTLDQMWCHVCRLHADKSHQNLALIRGSRMFKVHNIKKHSSSKYHQDSLQRYMLQVCELKL